MNSIKPRARVLLPALAALGLVLGLRLFVAAQPLRTGPPPRFRSAFDARVWDFSHPSLGPLRAIALVPRQLAPGARLPLLVAMHGLGETHRGVERGPWGWERDYDLGASATSLLRAPLDASDFLGLVRPDRLARLNADLARQPFRGLVVVTPFTPDVRSALGGPAHAAYDTWLVETLVARARRELPVLPTREHTGIDGVSLGGLHALWTGLGHPETFGSVGALQAAVRDRSDPVIARYSSAAGRPAQRIRIVTSEHDSLRPDVEALDAALTQRRIPHEFRLLAGPHDYPFNRGPGGVEMLLFHDRALRGEPCP